jgi:predicted NACHT family NTPase
MVLMRFTKTNVLKADEIGELIRTYPNCIYVVTTRPGAVESGWLARLNFTEARVEPINRSDREEFIDKWYQSAALELKKRPRLGEDLSLTASRLKAELIEQTELGKLASNPLLCAMICALYRERNEKLPETPAELSEALCHMLLHRRELETLGLGDKHFLVSWRALQYAQKKELLAELAWYMVSNVKSSIDRSEALQLVAKGLSSTPGRTEDEAEEVVQALIERSGLLRPASDDRIDFLHNTLKEYLAAGKVVGAGDWQELARHADDPAWQPVILFALAIAPNNSAQHW